jgi:hypothetical protein
MTALTEQKRSLITVDTPDGFLDLAVPPGWTLDKWYKHETRRLAALYPEPALPSTELPGRLADMLTAADSLYKLGEMKRRLVRLLIREQLGWAQEGTVNGWPVARRVQQDVRGYSVEPYSRDMIIAR